MNQEKKKRTEFPFELFHLTKSYDDILSDNEYLGRIRNLLSDITEINQEIDLPYGLIFESAYLICGLLTHPAYIQASFDEEFISYDMLEKLEDSLSIRKRHLPFVRCVTYLLLSRMDNPIRGTAYIVDELEQILKGGIHIIERPRRSDRQYTREYHFNFTELLRGFNREYTKKYHFDFGVKPLPPTLWNVVDIGFLVDSSITPDRFTVDFTYKLISFWSSLSDRAKVLDKIQAYFENKDYLEMYDEEEKREVAETVHCVINATFDRLKNEEEKQKSEAEQSENKQDSNSLLINVQHIETLNNYGVCHISTVENTVTPSTAMYEKRSSAVPFSALVTNPSKAVVVLEKLHELVDRPGKPKTIIMPVRAAMDAGAISRPTWEQFCTEFGKDRVKCKSSLTDYLCDAYTYVGGDFESMKETFRLLIQ